MDVIGDCFEAPIEVESIIKDEKPTGFLSNVHYVKIFYGPDKKIQDLFIKAPHNEKVETFSDNF